MCVCIYIYIYIYISESFCCVAVNIANQLYFNLNQLIKQINPFVSFRFFKLKHLQNKQILLKLAISLP